MNVPGWTWVKLKEIATKVGSGATPRGGKESYFAEGIPLIRSLNIHFDRFHYDGLVYLDGKQAANLNGAEVKSGDVLLNITGASIGRVNRCPDDLDGARVNQHVCIIRLVPQVDGAFLRYYLSSPQLQDIIFQVGFGVTRQALTKEMILNFALPIAPLCEQRRIVAKIEELFSELDAGVAALERARAGLKRYRAAVLKAAVEGKLTEDWRARHPDTEPASVLLERILTERRRKWEEAQLAKFAQAGKQPPKGWRDKYKEPGLPDTGELPSLPANWCWVALEAIAAIDGGITKDSKRNQTATMREVPYLRVANVQRGFLDLREIKSIVAEESEIDALRLIRGDVLFTEGGDRDKLGRGWVWNDEIEECIHQNHIFRARLFLRCMEPKFVSFHGNSFGQEWFTRTGKQTTNLASINKGILSRFPVPLAPLAEQAEIIAEADRRLSVIDEIEAQVEANLKRAARLRQGILKRAFEGKLVPQDPSDEPAEELLDRIRRERQESAATKNGKPAGRGRGRSRKTAAMLPFSARDDGNDEGGAP